MRKYCSLSTAGVDTNLQLFSLIQAQRYWGRLERDWNRFGDQTLLPHERCVFIVAALGLSISQLLGQNDPKPESAKVAAPRAIWKRMAKGYASLAVHDEEFQEFMDLYDACRHFGQTTTGMAYQRLQALEIEATGRWVEFVNSVWEAVIAILKENPDNSLYDVEDVRRIQDYYPTV